MPISGLKFNERTGHWLIDTQFRFRRIRMVVGPDKDQAIAVLNQMRVRLRDEAFNVRSTKSENSMLFKDLAAEYIEQSKPRKRSWKSDTYLVKTILPSIGNIQISRLGPPDMQNFIQKRLRDRTPKGTPPRPKSINLALTLASSICQYAVDMGYISENVCRKVKRLKVAVPPTEYLNIQEINKLLEVTEGQFHSILLCAIDTGARKGEILGMQFSQLDFQNRTWQIPLSKTDRSRIVYLTDRLIKELQGIQRMLGCEYVFHHPNGKPFLEIRKHWATALRLAGITRHIRWHDTRHTAASQMIMAGLDLLTVSHALGHTSTKMTERYAHLSDAHRREAARKFESALTGKAKGTETDVISLPSVYMGERNDT